MKTQKRNQVIQLIRNIEAMILKYYRWKIRNAIKWYYLDIYNNDKNLFL